MYGCSWWNCDCRDASGIFTSYYDWTNFSVTDLTVKQPGDRTCTTEAIGGAHYGPVQVYLTKVSDASTADGSTGWFKIFKDDWAKIAGSSDAAADNWGTKDLNTCCGRMNVKIPSDIPAGDYLLRAEVIALHVAGSVGGAQFYMSCCMFTSFLFKLPPYWASIYASSPLIHCCAILLTDLFRQTRSLSLEADQLVLEPSYYLEPTQLLTQES